MSDPIGVFGRLVMLCVVPMLLAAPLLWAVLTPNRVRSDSQRMMVRTRMSALVIFTLIAFAAWGGLLLMSLQLPATNPIEAGPLAYVGRSFPTLVWFSDALDSGEELRLAAFSATIRCWRQFVLWTCRSHRVAGQPECTRCLSKVGNGQSVSDCRWHASCGSRCAGSILLPIPRPSSQVKSPSICGLWHSRSIPSAWLANGSLSRTPSNSPIWNLNRWILRVRGIFKKCIANIGGRRSDFCTG
jgi:hypothetical protein